MFWSYSFLAYNISSASCGVFTNACEIATGFVATRCKPVSPLEAG